MRIPDTVCAVVGDAAVAYQVYGSGEHRVVEVPAAFSNVELGWEWSPFHHWLERWGSFATVVAFDKRGTGCSERVEVPATLEEQMEDFNVVLDAVGWERATIHEHSEGGAVACLFAAAYPERTESLILQGCFARWVRAPDYKIGVDRSGYDRGTAALARHWGTPETLIIPFMAPSQVGDDAYLRWTMRGERHSSTPRDLLAAAALNADVDVRPVLPAIRVPTLVVQARQDRIVPVEHGRYLAANIPGATLFEYDGEHLPLLVGVDESMDAIEAFVAGSVHRQAADQVLATVLFTDICGSTERAATLGDHNWRGLLDRHDKVLRVALERHGGAEVRTTGDGMLATFDSPARAVRCALDMIEAARATGLDIRAGVHTGEVEHRAGAADESRARDRAAGCRRAAVSGHRRAAVRLGSHRRQPPRPDLHQARRGRSLRAA
jgi:pimeloyl-ACP methyl ester carboxylesterase